EGERRLEDEARLLEALADRADERHAVLVLALPRGALRQRGGAGADLDLRRGDQRDRLRLARVERDAARAAGTLDELLAFLGQGRLARGGLQLERAAAVAEPRRHRERQLLGLQRLRDVERVAHRLRLARRERLRRDLRAELAHLVLFEDLAVLVDDERAQHVG